jgi:hypothetical protein
MRGAWPWLALAGLGAFHGLNPAMGWLFAVALGLQRHSREAVLKALVPIAAGHALSIALIVLIASALRALLEPRVLQLGAAAVLIGFGLYRLLARHRGRVGMQVSAAQLLFWSFLMATAHGAGLMLLPVVLAMPPDALGVPHAHMHTHDLAAIGSSAGATLAVIGVHTAAMLCVAGAVGLAVYDWVGLAFLRRGWINLDLVWVCALMAAGGILLVMALLG